MEHQLTPDPMIPVRAASRGWGSAIARTLRQHLPFLMPALALLLLLAYYYARQPLILTPFGINITANQGMTLALATMAQVVVVLTAGIDLSVGPLVGLANCVAATFMGHSPAGVVLTVVATLLMGALAGMFNGLVIAYGRLQPIIVTLATWYIFSGLSLFVRPDPGGQVPYFYASLLTSPRGYLPSSVVLLAVVLLVVWLPLKRSRLGSAIYAVGSHEGAAYMSGVNVAFTKVAAYTIAGLLAAVAGLFLTAQTTSGDATIGGVYTLNSIAAVVLGGTKLSGGSGGVAGPIVAAFLISMIVSVLFASGVSPFYQDVFQGGILLLAVALGSIQVLRARNRMKGMNG